MNESLYFIPIIEAALRKAGSAAALIKAFDEIQRKGRQKRYREGFRNFELFMDLAYRHYQIINEGCLGELMVQLAAGTIEATELEKELLLSVISSDSKLQSQYQQIISASRQDDAIAYPIIELHTEKKMAGQITFAREQSRGYIRNLCPGQYTLKLANTNRVIWKGHLTGKDLLWFQAYGTAALELAAETEGVRRKVTHEITLPNAGIIMRSFAGIESGSIEIELIG